MKNKIYDSIVKKEPITAGWSDDKKYCVTTTKGVKYLLRISSLSRYEHRKSLYSMMEQVADLGVPMSVPVEFGTCDDGVYSIQSWIDGGDLESVLPNLSEAEQYLLGYKSGEILQKIHNVFVNDMQSERPDWGASFDHTTDERIQKYRDCGTRFDGDESVIAYLEENKNLIENRPRCFQHGDYSVRNMMLENGELKIIDFERLYFGDPWGDFTYVMLDAPEKQYFSTGQVRGYFNGEPPLEFFKIYTFYVLSSLLPAYYDIEALWDGEIDKLTKQTQEILAWFDNMQNPVPTWYLKDFHVQYIKDTPIYLTKPFDFSCLEKYGTITKVVKHEKGAGNLCFCAEENNKKYFIKFAGAPVENLLDCKPEQVIKQIYQDLAHENLIKLVKSEEAGGGYVNIFEWVDAECIGYPSPPSRQKFLSLTTEAKMRAFDDILNFHSHVAAKGYVAIDFYADQILYDFENNKTMICDIDFYQKSPYYGDKGAWGSSNFVSPEELIPGSRIDKITMVYAMGATAFCIFADYDRSPEAWTLSPELYAVAKRAVSDERSERQQSIEQLIAEWKGGKA